MFALGVDVQDTFFDSGRKCVAMVTAYYGKNGGKILRRELLPQFFTNSQKMCLAHLHPKANICAKFHENW